MVSPDNPHRDDIDELNADLSRRLGKPVTTTSQTPAAVASSPLRLPTAQQVAPPQPSAPEPTRRAAWVPVALAALLCLGLGLAGGWLLFGRDGSDPAPVAVTDEPAETQVQEETPATPDETSDSITLDDLFDQLEGDTSLGELPLDDFMSPDDVDDLEKFLESIPTADELNELFGDLDGQNLNEFLDPESLDEMNQILEELFGE